MAFDYANTKATADRILTKFGQTVAITRSSVGVYDPATGTAPVTTTVETGKAALLEYTMRGDGQSEVNGTSILQGDKDLWLSAVGISVPQINDTVVASGKTYTIKQVKEENPAGTAVYFRCNVRGV